eukprot:SAG11_NODE_1072_length_5974_cov_1.634553_4_plen_328_part_00
MKLLKFMYTDAFGRTLNFYGLLYLDVRKFAMSNCDTADLQKLHHRGFFSDFWYFIVLQPFVLLTVVVLLWGREHGKVAKITNVNIASRRKIELQASTRANAFFVAHLLYPQMLNTAIGALECTSISERLTVLSRDYDVECTDEYYSYALIVCVVVLVIVGLGVPAATFYAVYTVDKTSARLARIAKVRNAPAKKSGVDSEPKGGGPINVTEINYSCLTDDFKAEHRYFETIDLLRKALLVGLGVVWRGTDIQVFIVTLSCFGFMTCYVYVQPYFLAKSNGACSINTRIVDASFSRTAQQFGGRFMLRELVCPKLSRQQLRRSCSLSC